MSVNDLIEREAVLEHYRVTDPAGTFVFCDSILDFVQSLPPAPQWIPCDERLPEMHDAGILKNCGIIQRSDKVIITIEMNGERIVDNNAELRDGKWYSVFIRFLEARKKNYRVVAWIPLPEPYREDES